MIYIGIDTGTHTGIAIWDTKQKKFLEVKTLPIHKAIELVLTYATTFPDVFVIFEDARQRKWFGRTTRGKEQGAGSIKRDCSIWEEFLKDKKISFNAVPPMVGGTKMKEEYFRKLTGWTDRTSNHARDACMLVFGK